MRALALAAGPCDVKLYQVQYWIKTTELVVSITSDVTIAYKLRLFSPDTALFIIVVTPDQFYTEAGLKYATW